MKEDIYYIPTKEDYERDPDYYSTQFGRKYYSRIGTTIMPIEPIEPSKLVRKVIAQLESFDNVIADDIALQIESFAKLFNFAIQSNQDTKSNARLVYAAQTGTAKSLSLKTYVSFLQEHSSLIVVSKVDEALEYCKYINELRDDDTYARCYYSVTDKNKQNDLRVDKNELKNFQCIVVSHAMFKNINQTDSDSVDKYKLYKDKQRDLVVIDEKLNLYKKVEVSYKQLNNFFLKLDAYVKEQGKEEQESLGVLISILKLIKEHKEVEIHDTKNNYIDFDDKYLDYLHKQFPDIDEELDKLVSLATAKLDTIKDELYILGGVRSDSIINTALNNINEIVDTLRILFKKDTQHTTYYYKSNSEEILFQVHDIANKLGTAVVLDATASINEFYKVAYVHNYDIYEVYAKPIRVYTNLSIYKAKGFRQGRNSIYKGLSKNEVTDNAQMYLSYALNTLNSLNDKMLIITHKGFKLSLQKICSDSRIRFTHWGNHIGKNDWSDCNIVMLIGWNLIPQKEHIFNVFNAIRNEDISSYAIDKEVLKNFQNTQLADDLIQGIMRSQARKIGTKDGDCKKTKVYLFYEEVKLYNEVLDIVFSEFPKCNVMDWSPIGISKKVKKTKRNNNADIVISYLQEQESECRDIMLKRVIQELELKSYQMSRIISTEYFLQELDKKGYKLKNSDGKSKYFILK